MSGESIGERLQAQLDEKRVDGNVNPEFLLPIAVQQRLALTRVGKHWRVNSETHKLEEVQP